MRAEKVEELFEINPNPTVARFVLGWAIIQEERDKFGAGYRRLTDFFSSPAFAWADYYGAQLDKLPSGRISITGHFEILE